MQAPTIVRKAGYVRRIPFRWNTAMFGMMLGKDGKTFKTRARCETDLLDEGRWSARVVWWRRRTRYAG